MDDIEKLMARLDKSYPAWETRFATQQQLNQFAEDAKRKPTDTFNAFTNLRWSVARHIWPIANAAYEAFVEDKPPAN